jgi:hypothetical protein
MANATAWILPSVEIHEQTFIFVNGMIPWLWLTGADKYYLSGVLNTAILVLQPSTTRSTDTSPDQRPHQFTYFPSPEITTAVE